MKIFTIGKSGKPNPRKNEYTVIAGLVEYRGKTSPNVVCLTTGTKCFPNNVPYRHEDIVDCHAEPLLKRAFKCYLIKMINDWFDTNKNLDQFYDKGFISNQIILYFQILIKLYCSIKWTSLLPFC